MEVEIIEGSGSVICSGNACGTHLERVASDHNATAKTCRSQFLRKTSKTRQFRFFTGKIRATSDGLNILSPDEGVDDYNRSKTVYAPLTHGGISTIKIDQHLTINNIKKHKVIKDKKVFRCGKNERN